MQKGVIAIGAAFAVALAYFIGSRLSAEALAVVVGSVCGISASIPVSIALVIAASNNWGRREESPEPNYPPDPRRYAPPMPYMIVSPPQAQMPYGYPPSPYYLPMQTPVSGITQGPREFKIIGGE